MDGREDLPQPANADLRHSEQLSVSDSQNDVRLPRPPHSHYRPHSRANWAEISMIGGQFDRRCELFEHSALSGGLLLGSAQQLQFLHPRTQRRLVRPSMGRSRRCAAL